MNALVRLGPDSTVVCGSCQALVEELTRHQDWEEWPDVAPYRVCYRVAESVITHRPCGCAWQSARGEAYTLHAPPGARQRARQPVATCTVCQVPPGVHGRGDRRSQPGCEHFTLLTEVVVPVGGWLAGWPPWHQLGAGDYWTTVQPTSQGVRYQLWRGVGAELAGAADRQTVTAGQALAHQLGDGGEQGEADGREVTFEGIAVAGIAARPEDGGVQLAEPEDGWWSPPEWAPLPEDAEGYAYWTGDGPDTWQDLQAAMCWRCTATPVPAEDVVGLCPPCLADLQGRRTE